jgi:replication factor A1
MQIPPEVLAYVGHKFTFIVKILYKSIDAPEPSFEVVLIKEKFGKETFFPKPESCQVLSMGSSSSASATYKNLPPLVPIGSKKIDHQVQI